MKSRSTSSISHSQTDDLTHSELYSILKKACSVAISGETDRLLPRGKLNALRSRAWVSALRDQMLYAYQAKQIEHVRAFCKTCKDNRKEFGLNELLHDVCVCRVAAVTSRQQRKQIMFVSEVLWQVESEFKNSGTDAIKDFNKLILGSARQKLFVGPLTSDRQGDLTMLASGAAVCSGDVYVAFVLHPDQWITPELDPILFRFDLVSRQWIPLSA